MRGYVPYLGILPYRYFILWIACAMHLTCLLFSSIILFSTPSNGDKYFRLHCTSICFPTSRTAKYLLYSYKNMFISWHYGFNSKERFANSFPWEVKAYLMIYLSERNHVEYIYLFELMKNNVNNFIFKRNIVWYYCFIAWMNAERVTTIF